MIIIIMDVKISVLFRYISAELLVERLRTTLQEPRFKKHLQRADSAITVNNK